MIKGLNFWVRCRTTAVMLGTQPSNPNIHRDFIASKNPNAELAARETSYIEETLRINENPDVAGDDADLQMTVYPRARFFQDDATGKLYDPEYDIIPEGLEGSYVTLPFIFDYQLRGSFKESIAMLAKASGGKGAAKKAAKTADAPAEEAAPAAPAAEEAPAPKKRGRRKKADIEAEQAAMALKAAENNAKLVGNVDVVELPDDKPAHYDCADITAHKKVVDGNWFVTNPKVPLLLPETFTDAMGNEIPTYDEHGRLRTLQRALRAETAKGPRTALATSEMVPAGTEFFYGIKLLNEKNLKACLETLDYKADMGMLQWRGGGKGTLVWTLCNREGVPYDDLYEDELSPIDKSIIAKVCKIIPGAVTVKTR
jgi:hypothetical protein